jgi:site-specific recombinase XerD
MWSEVATWQEQLHLRPDLSAKTIGLYTQDARRFAIWLQQEHPGLKATDVTPTDAKTYRDYLLAKRYAPTTIMRFDNLIRIKREISKRAYAGCA